jgi:uncharacterized protein (TIGR02117 family)
VRLAAALLSGFMLVECSGSLPPDAQVPTSDASVYVVERGWHTDIGLPVGEIAGPLATLEHGYPGVQFMVFGFGERAYYMARRTGSAELLTAMFPSESAILMTALSASPTEAFADQHVVQLHLPQDAVDRIANRIWQVLEKGSDGSAVRLADGPYPGSVFLASTETYDLFNTCNTWTAAVLNDAGLPIDPRVLLADQVMQQVDRIATLQARQRR